ncbi:cytochrome P450 monooxygenase [Xylogone sp. PMI_703]|nr:cytochrome P450 monooxygenase [Xylogone sp. PMI_703]
MSTTILPVLNTTPGLLFIPLLLCILIIRYIIHPIFFSPLSRIPAAHFSVHVSGLWIAYQRYVGREVAAIHEAHCRLGPVVRLGRREVSVSDVEGVRVVYRWDKPAWYGRAFDNYGIPNMFSTLKKKPHSERKKTLANLYSKTVLFSSSPLAVISHTTVVERLLPFIHSSAISSIPINVQEIFLAFAIDFVSAYIFGTAAGTNFMENETERRRWLAQHHKSKVASFWKVEYPGVMRLLDWIGVKLISKEVQEAGKEVKDLCFRLMEKAERIRGNQMRLSKEPLNTGSPPVLYEQLEAHIHPTIPSSGNDTLSSVSKQLPMQYLKRLTIASELMDHIKAGTETSGWGLTYIVYELSKRPEQQVRLREELRSIDEPFYFLERTGTETQTSGSSLGASAARAESLSSPPIIPTPSPKALDSLPLLSAIIHETLRLHPPVAGPQPRITPSNNTQLPGYDGLLPGGIRISAQAYTLHRNESVFPAAEEWCPERWLEASPEHAAVMQRWFWAFGSGGRMCVGRDFAMIELKLVLAAIYTNYTTRIIDDEGIEMKDGYSPGPKGNSLVVQFRLV